jgi:hypothetical protein
MAVDGGPRRYAFDGAVARAHRPADVHGSVEVVPSGSRRRESNGRNAGSGAQRAMNSLHPIRDAAHSPFNLQSPTA